jgi:hypothetical protein
MLVAVVAVEVEVALETDVAVSSKRLCSLNGPEQPIRYGGTASQLEPALCVVNGDSETTFSG